jgi:outer membrane scaffolding protein for murein synthesis (MipA/OmpV family)
MTGTISRLGLAAALTAGAGGALGAEDGENRIGGFVSAGVGLAPDYEGSESYDPIPLAAFRVNYAQYWVAPEGLTLQANLVPSDRFEAGPAFAYSFGRDEDVEDSAVSRLREIDDSFELGDFAVVDFFEVLTPRDAVNPRVTVLHEESGETDGLTAEGSVSWSFPIGERVRTGLGASATFADSDYMEAFFGIDADNAARSGLALYDADSGLKDVGLSVTGTYSITENWGVTAIAAYTRLVGDAADSPIVEDAGSPNQFFGGFGLSYRFQRL